MTVEFPLWMQADLYAARLDRNLIAQLWDEGVMDLVAYKVTQRGAGANFSVDVAAGDAVVGGDDQVDQGNYMVKSTATVNVVLDAAPASNSRYDLIVLQINDPNAGGAAGSNAVPKMVKGTAAASPTVPATPASAILLATVGPIASSTASITDAIIADSRLLAGRRTSTGEMAAMANTSAAVPNGWLLAAGQAISRSTFARLFAHLSTTFGTGDGSTTFNLPDLRGRVPVGLDNMGGTDAGRLAAANVLGGSGGAETHTLTAAESGVGAHTHTGPSHTHAIDHDHPATNVTEATSGASVGVFNGVGPPVAGLNTNVSADYLVVNLPNFTGASGAGGTAATGSTSGGAASAHNILQPYQLVNWIIRT